eukprot:1953005-Rhodomonas_salina.1
MAAARLGSEEMVRVLLHSGAHAGATNAEGEDAADMAMRRHGVESGVPKLLDPSKVARHVAQRR